MVLLDRDHLSSRVTVLYTPSPCLSSFATAWIRLQDPTVIHVVPQTGDRSGSDGAQAQHLGPTESTATSESVERLVGELVLTQGDGGLTEDETETHRDGGEERGEGESDDRGPLDEIRGGLTGEESHGGVLQEAAMSDHQLWLHHPARDVGTVNGILDSLHDSDSGKRDPDGVGQLLLPRVGPRGTPCVYPVKGQGGVDDDEEVGELELFGVPYDCKQARQGKRERERERSDGVSVEDCENEARLTLSIRKRQHRTTR